MTEAAQADPFARQRLIEGWDQDRIRTATAVVAGSGALGNEVAKNLALAGAGRLILCDPDVVEPSNLSRCVLFTRDDVGRPKVEAAAAALAALAPATQVVARRATLASGVGLGELACAQIVLGCLDSRQARQELLGRCALAGAPLVDGGTGPWSGEVRVRTGPEEGCYVCSLTPYERGESDVPRSCAEIQPPGHEPASIAITALTAAWMTTTAMRILLALPVTYPALRIDAVTGSTAQLKLPRDPQCPYHEPPPGVDRQLEVTNHDTVADFLAAVPHAVDAHAWAAFSVTFSCLRCGAKTGYDEERKAAGLSRCAQCGAVIRHRVSSNLVEADPSASLRALGVAPREILRVRTAEGGIQWVKLAG